MLQLRGIDLRKMTLSLSYSWPLLCTCPVRLQTLSAWKLSTQASHMDVCSISAS